MLDLPGRIRRSKGSCEMLLADVSEDPVALFAYRTVPPHSSFHFQEVKKTLPPFGHYRTLVRRLAPRMPVMTRVAD